MKVSLNTIKQFTEINISVDELVEKINQQLGGVDEVIYLGERYKDAVIAKVVKCEKHPNADKLSVCDIDAGTGENIQVVCGAPNVREGIFVVWLPPNAIVPSTFDDKEPFILEPKELRGVISNGMLASAKELGLGNDHDGIVEVNQSDVRDGKSFAAGDSFAEVFGLNDTIIDIENKMFTHRPDLFGQMGVAREIHAILQPEPNAEEHGDNRRGEPDWYWKMQEFSDASGLELDVFNDITEKVPRFMAVAMKDIEVKPSPLWLQCALVAMGSKSINNIVDATNYTMLLTAQPTHAYDYDKLRGGKLGVRMATEGEEVKLLNDKTYKLDKSDIVIVDGEGVVGLGGIMGGGNSEVSTDTTNIVLEVATFDMYTARRSSMRHGVFTDALTRFNKGQSPLQNDRVIGQLMRMIEELGGGTQASKMFDLSDPTFKAAYDNQTLARDLMVTADFVSERIGKKLNGAQIGNLLRPAGFAVYPPGDDSEELSVNPPFWRTDIELPEDVVEEVGRLYGFDKLPRELPKRSIQPVRTHQLRITKQYMRDLLAKAGANEVLTYSFVHEDLMKKTGQDPNQAYRLSNALSPDLQYYRLSLMPSLLDKVHMNIKARHDEFALFEVGKTHLKGEMDKSEVAVPNEPNHIALVVAKTDKQRPTTSPYYLALRYAQTVADFSSLEICKLSEIDVSNDNPAKQLVAPYAIDRSAALMKEGKICGVVGEFKVEVRQALKLPDYTAGFEISLDAVSSPRKSYRVLSRFPSVTQDISIEINSTRSVGSVLSAANSSIDSLSDEWTATMEIVSIYQPDSDGNKTISLRLTVANHTKSLTDKDVTIILDDIRTAVLAG